MGCNVGKPVNNCIKDNHNTEMDLQSHDNMNDIDSLLSHSLLIINPYTDISARGKTLIIENNSSDWRFILILHNDLVNHINKNSLSIQLKFGKINPNNYTDPESFTMHSGLKSTQTIEGTNLCCYCFNYNHKKKINNGLQYSIDISLGTHSHHLFNIIFENNIKGKKHKGSYYDIFRKGLNEYNEDEFLKYWALCLEKIDDISRVTYYMLSKNNVNEENIIYDPWFALFSLMETKLDHILSKLNDIDPNINWKKICYVSQNFYIKYRYHPEHITEALRNFPQSINLLINVCGITDVQLIGSVFQEYHNIYKKMYSP